MVVVYKFSPRFVRKEHLHFTGNFLENVGNHSISGCPLGIPDSVRVTWLLPSAKESRIVDLVVN